MSEFDDFMRKLRARNAIAKALRWTQNMAVEPWIAAELAEKELGHAAAFICGQIVTDYYKTEEGRREMAVHAFGPNGKPRSKSHLVSLYRRN